MRRSPERSPRGGRPGRLLILLGALALALAAAPAGHAEDPPAPPVPPAPPTPPAPPAEPGAPADRAAEFFREFDADGDGAVTRAEAARVPASVFALLDRNADGRIDRAEAGPPRPARRAGDAGPGMGPEPTPEQRLARLKEAFGRRDANGDGTLAGDELPERMREAADADQDGKVTFEEFQGAMERMRAAFGARRGPPAPGVPPGPGGPPAPDAPPAPDKPATPDKPADPLATGQVAPEFSLPGHDGQTHSLSAHRGSVVVLEWYNPECPAVRPHYESGRMQALQKKWCDRGVVWLTVCSSGPGLQGHKTAEEHARIFAEWNGASRAVLLDPTGRVGKAFGARTTPHVFVLDAQGRLAYDGAPDERAARGRPADAPAPRAFLDEALDAVTQGRAPAVARTTPYG